MTFPIQWSVACDARAVLGESPVFDPRDGRVWWVDIKGCALWSYDPAHSLSRNWSLAGRVSCLAVPDRHWPSERCGAGSFLCAGDSGFAWLTVRGNSVTVEPIAHPEAHLPGNRFNDGTLAPDGRFFAASMDDSEKQAAGTLYALTPEGEVQPLRSGYLVPNGPVFDPKGDAFFHNDSPHRITYRIPLNPDGTAGDAEPFHRFGAEDGYPDGMAIDEEGNLYIALWDGGGIAVLSPEGERLGFLPLPTARVTACAFHGENPRRLYATSASIGRPAENPYAGNLFEIDLL